MNIRLKYDKDVDQRAKRRMRQRFNRIKDQIEPAVMDMLLTGEAQITVALKRKKKSNVKIKRKYKKKEKLPKSKMQFITGT
jgi:hypothetical protein